MTHQSQVWMRRTLFRVIFFVHVRRFDFPETFPASAFGRIIRTTWMAIRLRSHDW